MLFAREHSTCRDPVTAAKVIAEATEEVVKRQVAAGIDVVSDGEMSKISYATYIADRFTGFDGDTPREPGQDLVEFPRLLEKLAKLARRRSTGGRVASARSAPRLSSRCRRTCATSARPCRAGKPADAFLNAASPGVIALFQPNDFYQTSDEYLEAVAEAMRVEYEAIVAAGFLVQIDAPDLGMGRHTMYRHASVAEYLGRAELHVEVLNHALRNVPAERVRMHCCWGNYEGPHHHDVPMSDLLPVLLKAKPQALLFEAANPRHAHEWTVFRDAKLPDDKILIPGVLSSTTNYVEHPELVAERLLRFADIVGRERVMAGSDCGFSTFAGFGAVDPDIVYLKLAAMAEGARLASRKLWK